MNPCQRFKKSLFKFIDGELDILQRKFVEQHLKDCRHCHRLVEQIDSVRFRIRNLSRIETSENFHILLRERIRREMAGKRTSFPATPVFSYRWVPAVGLCIVMIITGFWMIDQKTSVLNRTYIAEVKNVPSSPPDNEFGGYVDYIIDDYPASSSLSVSRDEVQLSRTDADTLPVQQLSEEVQAFLTPVDF